jgi:hypothetical protein
LDERWVDTGVVSEGGDLGDVNANSITKRKDATSFCIGDELLGEVGSKFSGDGGWVFEASAGSGVYIIVRGLNPLACRESNSWNSALDCSVCCADCARECVQKGTQVPTEIRSLMT